MNNILDKVDEIVNLIKESSDYKKYLSLAAKIENNSEIMDKINAVKKLQKKIVNLDYRKEKTDALEQEINNILFELESYPIYREFCYVQEDLNENFQDIKNVIEDYINKKLN